MLFVHLGYELFIVGRDFEHVFFHEEFEVVEHVFFFGVREEDAVDVSEVYGFEFVDYCVSYACFVHVDVFEVEDLVGSGDVGDDLGVWRVEWELAFVYESYFAFFVFLDDC